MREEDHASIEPGTWQLARPSVASKSVGLSPVLRVSYPIRLATYTIQPSRFINFSLYVFIYHRPSHHRQSTQHKTKHEKFISQHWLFFIHASIIAYCYHTILFFFISFLSPLYWELKQIKNVEVFLINRREKKKKKKKKNKTKQNKRRRLWQSLAPSSTLATRHAILTTIWQNLPVD